MAICVDREKCIGCESCIAVCPVGALNMVDGKANIDQDTCIACGACIGECPVEAIEREEIVREVKNKEGKDLWVNVELEDGEPVGVVYELLGVGAELAAKADQKCCAVLICKEAGSLPHKLFAAGADIVYVVSGPEYAEYNTDIYTNAFCELVETYKPNAVLCGATVDGRDLAPRIAARLGTGLCADCTALDINTAWKLSPYFRPLQIPAAMAYTFFSTELYSIPATSLLTDVLMNELARRRAMVHALSVSGQAMVR